MNVRVNEENFFPGAASDVEPSYVEIVVGNHNADGESHSDIREMIRGTKAFYENAKASVEGVAKTAIAAQNDSEASAVRSAESEASAVSAKNDAESAKNSAELAARRYPYIGANGNWFVWDMETGRHVDTGVPAKADVPVKGMDYWTEEDIAEIKSYVDDAILGGEW